MGKLSSAKKLTKTEKYAIEGMNSNGMKSEAIAQALGRSVSLVSAYLQEYEQSKSKSQTTVSETANGNRGVAIMTEATSQRVDSMRGKAGRKGGHPNIHSIK
tara:strand:- start:1107 stop:1412 length:306 start_codon:yes stop_codon:yes gene_type:complete